MEHRIFDLVATLVLICSVLHTILPPWDVFNDFPRTQKYYKVVIYTVGYIALNARSTAYKQLSMGKQVDAAADAATKKVSDV